MALEDVVEGWFEDFEKKENRENSRLYKIVKYSIELTKPQYGSQSSLVELIGILSTLFGEGHAPQRTMLAYLQQRLPELHKGGGHSNVYSQLTPEVVIDELYILFYLGGWLPRVVKGEKVRVRSPKALHLMGFGSAKLRSDEIMEREDLRFYHLVSRVSQRHTKRIHSRTNGPNWTDLVEQVFMFPPIMQRYRPVESFRAYMGERYNFDRYVVERLRQYLVGEKAIQTPTGLVRISPMTNLELLRRANIKRGVDTSLQGLLFEVTYHERSGGKSWTQYQDIAGRLEDVVAFQGAELNSRLISHGITARSRIILGRPNEADDCATLKAIVLGRAPVTYRNSMVLIEERDDLYVTLGFMEAFRNSELCAEELIPLFKRAGMRNKASTGLSPTQLLANVLADEEVNMKLGHTTPDDIYCLFVVHKLKEYLRPRVIGKSPFDINGDKVRIMPQENLQVLRPQSKIRDTVLRSCYLYLWEHRDTFDKGYWDILEEVLAEPKAAAYHGKALTRHDISPYAKPVVTVTAAIPSSLS